MDVVFGELNIFYIILDLVTERLHWTIWKTFFIFHMIYRNKLQIKRDLENIYHDELDIVL